MRRYKAVIFDMDGVITDSESLLETEFPKLCAEYGYTLTNKHIQDTLGTTMEFGKQYFAKEFGEQFPYELICQKFFDRLIAMAYRGEMQLKPGVLQLLEYLRKNHFPIALASSNTKHCVMSYLDAFHIKEYFSSILSGDDVDKGKPDPSLFINSAKNLNVHPDECIVIEDSLNGLRAAKAANMTSVFVPDLMPYSNLIAPFADYHFENIYQTIQLL